jgi:hypothetical protein
MLVWRLVCLMILNINEWKWKLLRDQFDARVREGSDIEVIFDAEFRRRFTELINRVIESRH